MNIQQLISLGFSEKEASVFLSLNQIGPSAASTLARITNLKRTSMYDILNSLLEKNLITSFRQGQYTYYAVDDLNKIYYQEKEKLDIAKNVIEQLKAIQKNPQNIDINYYKGREGYVEMYRDILAKKPKELMGWINLDKFYAAIDPVFEEQWTQQRVKKNIAVRLLLQNTPLVEAFQKNDAALRRETRLIPTSNLFETTCFLYENHVTFFDSSGSITGIRINHNGFYAMQKQIFEMNWQLFA